jgi:hypothetical protein
MQQPTTVLRGARAFPHPMPPGRSYPPDRRVCARCVNDEDTPGVVFGSDGVCSECVQHDRLVRAYPTGATGQQRLGELVATIRQEGRGRRFDCVVGLSGGTNSAWLLVRLMELGLRPLAVHFEDGWNTSAATDNLHALLRALDVEVFLAGVDTDEFHDIQRAFLRAGVQDVEAATTVAAAATLHRACTEFGVRTIVDGHCFRLDGVLPASASPPDGRYVQGVHMRYGTMRMRTYPKVTLSTLLWWSAVKGIRTVRPLYHEDYDREAAARSLGERFGWNFAADGEENRFRDFCGRYLQPVRWNCDRRVSRNAALVRSGRLSREEALRLLQLPPLDDPELVEYLKRRLSLTDDEFERLLALPRRAYGDYPGYREQVARLRPLFWLLARMDRLPAGLRPDALTPT